MAEVSLIDASAKPVYDHRGAQGLAKFSTFTKKGHSPGDDDADASKKPHLRRLRLACR